MRRSTLVLLAAFLATAAGSAVAEPVFSVSAAWRAGQPGPGATAVAEIVVEVAPGWHVNSNMPLDPFLIPTTVSLQFPDGWAAGEPAFPKHRLARFSFSPDDPVAVFEGSFTVTVPVTRSADAVATTESLGGILEAQACDDTTCLAPERIRFALPVGDSVPTAQVAGESDGQPPSATAGQPLVSYDEGGSGARSLSERFAGSGLMLQLLIAFLAGLALNLTPCVYPLIPITVGFFMSQNSSSRSRTWLLALFYVLGMSVTYSALGVAAALTGQLFGSALQSPWVVGLIIAVLLALAASMFGAWELRVPAWATRASGGRSGVLGAVVMGLVVGLVAAPCIGPFVLGLLTYVGQRGDVALGFFMFFALSLGLGLPYLFLAVFTGAIERLPNSGAWMTGVRQLFGVLLVALAVYFLGPFLPGDFGSRVMATALGLGGLYLLVVARPGHEQPWVDRFMRLASVALVVAAVLLYPSARSDGVSELRWESFSESRLAAAADAGDLVVVDFYADWCLPCKELDEKTFSDPEVRAELERAVRMKVDLTASTPASEALRSRFSIAGVPTILFMRAGEEVPGTRLTGFEPPARFLDRLGRAFGR